MTETGPRSGRLSADDWAREALDQIAEQGVASVAVEPLARRLGVTKGSFYWHFPSRDALLQAALERWEIVEQEEVFGSLEKVADPRERLRALFLVVAHEVKSHIIYSELLKALDLGQVDTLLVHDPADAIFGPEPRLIDRCIKQALLTGSDIHVVPNVDVLDNGVAALLRW